MTSVRERIAEERRQEIVEAAFRLFVHKGLAGATMQDIASEVGLTAGALYRYFPGKQELIDAVFTDCDAERARIFGEGLEAPRSPLEAIMATGREAWGMFKDDSGRDRVAMGLESALASYRHEADAGSSPAAFARRSIDLMTSLVAGAQAAGELDSSLDARAVAITLLALWEGVGHFVVQLDGEIPVDGTFEVAVRMLEALRPGAVAEADESVTGGVAEKGI